MAKHGLLCYGWIHMASCAMVAVQCIKRVEYGQLCTIQKCIYGMVDCVMAACAWSGMARCAMVGCAWLAVHGYLCHG